MTIPTATSYAAEVLLKSALMMANSPTFQTLAGAADLAAAYGRIVLLEGGRYDDDEQATDPQATAMDGAAFSLRDGKAWAHVAPRLPEQSADDPVFRSFQRQGSIAIRLAIPRISSHHPAQSIMDALNKGGAIEQELMAAYSAEYALLAGGVSLSVEGLPAVGSWAAGLRFLMFTLDWRDTP